MKLMIVIRTTLLLVLSVFCACTNPAGDDAVFMPDGLVAYYRLNGDAVDKSGNGHDGVVVGAVAIADRNGNDNSALSFNGVSSYVRCGDILDDVFCAPVAKFSIAAWAKTRTMGRFSAGGGMMIGKSAGGTNGPYQWNITHADGVISAAVMSDPIAQNYINVSSPMPAGQWFHFVLVFDGSLAETDRVQLYVNGESVNTTILRDLGTLGTSTTNTGQQITIGAGHAAGAPTIPNNCYDGIIDEVRIYNKALTFSEQHDLFVSKN
jgi:hypothetical protein